MADAAKERKRVLADGPVTLREFNPRGEERFGHRVCIDCGNPIMGHWLIMDPDPELMSTYWCDKLRTQGSTGMAE